LGDLKKPHRELGGRAELHPFRAPLDRQDSRCRKQPVPFDLEDREWNYWGRRAEGQPFFGQIGLWGGKNSRPPINRVDRESVRVPAYYPDTESFREEIARHYECIELVDWEVGQILDALVADGLLEETAIFLFSDHGMGALRHKQFCYDGGTHVPLMVSLPKDTKSGQRDKRLISHIDIAAASLGVAGVAIPEWMDAQNFLDESVEPRRSVVSARDRCDYTIDRIRSLRTADYRYIRNFMTDRALMQPQYRDQWQTYRDLMRLGEAGKLTEAQAVLASKKRPAEELYAVQDDPDEIYNLAEDPEMAPVLQAMRLEMDAWIRDTSDRGELPESEAQLTALIERWGADRCVNPEYDLVK
jgi:arylsulfatase A-like enzyme